MASSFTKADLLAVFDEIKQQDETRFPLSEAQLKSLFNRAVFARGQQFVRDQQVLWVKANNDFTQVESQVIDDDGTTTDQLLTLSFATEQPSLEVHCSCQAKVHCKHAAAALIKLKLENSDDFADHYMIDDWFSELVKKRSESEKTTHVLLFELHHSPVGLQLLPKIAPHSDQGEYGQGRPLTEQQSLAQVTPSGLDEDDFRLFTWIRSQNSPGRLLLSGQWGAKALTQLISRGRLYFERQREPLTLSKPNTLSLFWQIDQKKAKLHFEPKIDGTHVLDTEPPFYVDVERQKIGAIETALSGEQIKDLSAFPQIDPDSVKSVTQRLNSHLPIDWQEAKKKVTEPFTLTFLSQSAPFVLEVSAGQANESLLRNLGLIACKGGLRKQYTFYSDCTLHTQQFLYELAHRIAPYGGQVERAPMQLLWQKKPSRIRLKVTALQGHRLSLNCYESGSSQRLTLNELRNASAYTAHHFYLQKNANQGSILYAEEACLAADFLTQFTAKNGQCTIPRSLFNYVLNEFGDLVEVPLELREKLTPPSRQDLLPAKLAQGVELREYQHFGYNWLQLLAHQGLGGILADDMGLGKTIQVIAYLGTALKKSKQPHLIICPTSLVSNWYREIQRFNPDLKVHIVGGQDRSKLLNKLDKPHVVLTSYNLFKRDFEHYAPITFASVVVDEAQAIKNAYSQLSQAVKKLNTHFRLALSGTPFENNLFELKSLFDFVLPGLLGSDEQFKRNFVDETGSVSALKQAIKPYILRRTKSEVLSELPNKTEVIKQLDMPASQNEVYQRFYTQLHTQLNELVQQQGIAKSKLQFLDALMKLRQICCHPQLVDSERNASSAKLNWLKQHLPRLLSDNHHVIVFSQFTSMLDIIANELSDMGIDFAMLTGKTRHRDEQVDAFQSGEKKVFLISLKAGGSGLNLTKADTVIHFDPWWNPAVEHQATDRAHRMGQQRSVFVYRLIMADSIEQQVLALANKKQDLLDTVLNDGLLSNNKIDDNQLLEILNLQEA